VRSLDNGTRHSDKSHDSLAIADGEVNYLWWFIQGSLMNPDVWQRLMRAWGFCDRHAWVHLNVETCVPPALSARPCLLYSALIQQGLDALAPRLLASRSRVALQLRSAGLCPICEMQLDPELSGAAPRQRFTSL
jgi:hypothetical protein